MQNSWEEIKQRPAKRLWAEMPVRRLIAVSDVHGSFSLFKALLEQVGFRPGEDGLVVVGDLVQKGSENLKTLRYAMKLARYPHTYFLHGNHELKLETDAAGIFEYVSWFRERSLYGEMLRSLGVGLPASVEEIPAMLRAVESAYGPELQFLRDLPDILETEHMIFAHAGLTDEDTQHQRLGPVTAWPGFFAEAPSFRKLLVVGHYPTANYVRDALFNGVLFDRARNVLTIDGGAGVMGVSQLNGVILHPATAQWTWESVDSFPKIQAPCDQAHQPGEPILWPDTGVEVLKRGAACSLCRYANGLVAEVPNTMLLERDGQTLTDDFPTERLAVQKGETLSLIAACPDRLLVMKRGRAGWLFLEPNGDK